MLYTGNKRVQAPWLMGGKAIDASTSSIALPQKVLFHNKYDSLTKNITLEVEGRVMDEEGLERDEDAK